MPITGPGDVGQIVPTIGVLGGEWRGSVTPWGAIEQWDGRGTLEWYVAADDRWHVPADESTVRQTRVDGTPVVETRVRVPQGDVVHRAFAVADHGGITLVEIHNDSPMPVAIAFAGCPVMSVRPPADVPIEGIDLPAGSVLFPVGHHATITVGLAHSRGARGALPGRLATASQVSKGWTATCDRASRLDLPDQTLTSAVTSARCELVLNGPPRPADDPVGFLLSVHQLVRMTGDADQWMPDVAEAVAQLSRRGRRDDAPGEVHVALDAATSIACRAGDERAVRDLADVRRRLDGRLAEQTAAAWLPAPDSQCGVRMVTAVERRLATHGDLLPRGFPADWLGQNFDVQRVPTAGDSTVSYAVRWHADRPAVLWETSGGPVHLTSSCLAPQWSSDLPTGEALWPATQPHVQSFS